MSVTKETRNIPLLDFWSRVVITSVSPCVDGGRWPVARSVGESIDVTAGIVVDGHETVGAEVIFRTEGQPEKSVRMKLRWNDEYLASFPAGEVGTAVYRVRAWRDAFATWQDQFKRRVAGGASTDELKTELKEGATILRRHTGEAKGSDLERLQRYVAEFEAGNIEIGLEQTVLALAARTDPRLGSVESQDVPIRVDPPWARFSAWYEFFPRSTADKPGTHGTLDDAAARLPRLKELGFDVIYLPPVHPIGTTFRKGKDNEPEAQPGEPGSPWAIGAKEGGHKAVHPDLGGMDAFDRFVARANSLDLRVALDIAFQTSPDHPYVHEHPDWFKHRADGTIRYAENPPKKYQDVYPFDFESKDWKGLWVELKSVFEFWIEHGVRIFRVDNPHTKPFAFWEWCLAELRKKHNDLVFLAEAFTNPKTMYLLARLGFNQSYTYFTWRNERDEIREYAEELFLSTVSDFFRPNFWPNTPDILHAYLVHGGRQAHMIRFILAATLSPTYGVYGPPFEHIDNAQHPRREEYANNEKYEVRTWNWDDPNSLQPLMKRINRIRRENPALQFARNIRFLDVDNPSILAFSKETSENLVICVVNTDPYHTQTGNVVIPLEDLGLPTDRSYQAHDLLGGEYFTWEGRQSFVKLNPYVAPAHILKVQREVRTERDFPYFEG